MVENLQVLGESGSGFIVKSLTIFLALCDWFLSLCSGEEAVRRKATSSLEGGKWFRREHKREGGVFLYHTPMLSKFPFTLWEAGFK